MSTNRPAPRQVPARTVARELRIVALPAAVSLGAMGAVAADHFGAPMLLGFGLGAIAAVLTVLMLPSLPTRRVTIALLGFGGLGALRQAGVSGTNLSVLFVVWALATLATLVVLDRAGAETTPAMAGSRPLPSRVPETARIVSLLALAIVIACVALVPTLTTKLGRHVWPGVEPSLFDRIKAPTSLRDSDTLDMTQRPRLTDRVVFTVDAARSDFWRGATYDSWDGETWTRSDDGLSTSLERDVASNVQVPVSAGDDGAITGDDFRQTFHVESGYTNVLFAAPSPRTIQTDKFVRGRPDGTVFVAGGSSNGFGKGSVYTVVSRHLLTTAADLREADARAVPRAILSQYARSTTATERVRAAASSVTAGATTTYDKVQALVEWIGANTKYSLDAPLSKPGVDVVDDFLFKTHLGWCEQIASSLVVLARSVGIPARLTTGFVPGSRDPLTGRFVVREKDAHAWAEIFFPGIGWQGFDPTASVPLAGDAPKGGSWLDSAREHALELGVIGLVLVLLVSVAPPLVSSWRRRRARRHSWGALALDRLERIGSRVGRRLEPGETPREYATALASRLDRPDLVEVGSAIDVDTYAERGAPPDVRAAADAVLTSIRP